MVTKENGMHFLRNESIKSALKSEYRQYLTGKLAREQKYLEHIDDDIEIGISSYESFTPDKPHKHPVATEHGFVLEGSVKVMMLDGERKEECFEKGDFFVIRPGVAYATKNKAGTEILFIKFPAGNDKELVDIDDDTKLWLSTWESDF